MIRNQNTSLIMPMPLFIALLGVFFCAWSASGNALNICVTTGCSLFQDLTVAGVSMWWYGAAAFGLLALLAMNGRPWLGVLASGFCLLMDIILLSIMLLTAPCVGCLFAALLFALCYTAFRHTTLRRETQITRSWLIAAWALLFVINIGAIIRAEVGTWPMLGPRDATIRVYFSPSCPACREAIASLSGRVNVAFYPLTENDDDVGMIAEMQQALAQGASMADALAQAKATGSSSFWQENSPERLFLRFRLLRNKAHVLSSGTQAVPFIEYQGLPSALSAKDGASSKSSNKNLPANKDATVPVDTDIAGSCTGGATPCP